nr:hypothetical protein [Nitrospira sp.]
MYRNISSGICSIFQTRDQRFYYTAFALLLVIQLCPIWFTAYPAMHDFPNHLARAQILHQYNDSESYRSIYEQDWRFFPNLAIDLIVPPLLNVVSIETAGKIFLSMMIVLFNVGLHALGFVVMGRPHWSALTATFFAFNYTFAYGFVNYTFGLGVFFLTLAAWLRMRSDWNVGRLLLMTLLALTCYFSHLSSFIFLGIAIGCLTGLDLVRTRALRSRDLLGLLPLVPTVVVYLFYASGIQHRNPMEWWTPIILKKLTGFSYPFVTHNLTVELTLSAVFAIILLILF